MSLAPPKKVCPRCRYEGSAEPCPECGLTGMESYRRARRARAASLSSAVAIIGGMGTALAGLALTLLLAIARNQAQHWTLRYSILSVGVTLVATALFPFRMRVFVVMRALAIAIVLLATILCWTAVRELLR